MNKFGNEKPLILIVDDIIENLQLLMAILRIEFTVITANNGPSALQLAVASPPPELILLDIRMPHMDGYEVLRRLKENPLSAEIPVIFISALSDEVNEVQGLDLGAVDYITKPINPAVTLLRVRHQVALKKAQSDLLKSQQATMQAGRLASIGYLAAGVAHEINTPVQYISNNLAYIRDSMDSIYLALEAAQKLAEATPNTEAAKLFNEVSTHEDIPFILEDLPKAIGQSQEGITHIAKIVQSMKEFSPLGGTEKLIGNIHKVLDSVITITHNASKNVATVTKHFAPNLPDILCNIDELRQVFLNLIINSIEAIESSHKQEENLGQIDITTELQGDFVSISFADTGDGVPEEIRDHIFDPFFTTKDVGQGAGQGLSLCYDIIVNKHDGKIEVGNMPDSGAIFTVCLPK
ncbi:MAG: response regulator [Candidatus Thiodiazotropha sp.]|jgi:two-component system, NtrC family, sensor kinase